ncbi:MAG: rhodanese-like domain-containing protein [Candidatus Hodarchaeota archaeon]
MIRNVKSQTSNLFFIVLLAGVLATVSKYIIYANKQTINEGDIKIEIESQLTSDPKENEITAKVQADQISLEILRGLVHTRSAIIVDARLSSLFEKGHIPGAINLPALRPKDNVLQKILKYPKYTTVVVYCESDNCSDSRSVADLLRSRGMKNVRTFTGGLQKWKQNGLTIETNS